MSKRTLMGSGLRLELDASEFYEGGTPAMVYGRGDASATFYTALEQGELDGGEVRLTKSQIAWLQAQEDTVVAFLDLDPRCA